MADYTAADFERSLAETEAHPNAWLDRTIMLAALRLVAEARPEWRDISEAPKDGTEILLAAPDPMLPGRWYRGVGQWSDSTELPGTVAGWFWSFAIRPTVWQPLPAPPRDTQEPT